MVYFLYLFGFLPGIIWLLFYLRKDAHPESNKMILKIFFFGVLAALLAFFLEKGFNSLISSLKEQKTLSTILVIFLGGAAIEEYLKYLVVKIGVFKNPELDEPPDLVLYLIISALGFASLENILVLSNYHPILTPTKALEVMGWRFVSATFLHALCSGTLGYFLALSFLNLKKRKKFFLLGLLTATSLHGFYNWSIIKIADLRKFILPIIILIIFSLFVSFSFKKLKRLKSVCKI
ncbi:MAG: PrsW family intramembrane metalloprotease [Patescibacteria group bacterium]|nr:PrsW family intramembrane metalloprotease [Patescibacteria group bacterium]